MTRFLFLSLATLVAATALAGEPVERDDLHHDEANTREQPRDRTVEREDLKQGAQTQEEPKGRIDLARQNVRYEGGRFIVTEAQSSGARIEVVHDEDAVRTTASDRQRDVRDDLRKTAQDLIDGSAHDN